MEVSNRIKTIAKLIKKGSNVADIGSDHGYLLIELLNNNIANKVIGIENKLGPFTNLKTNLSNIIEKYPNRCKLYLSSGLKDLSNEYETVVIAGMGFSTIESIILENKDKVKFIENFIIDSHNNMYELRKFIISLGFFISDEVALIENEIYYELISFTKGNKDYSDIELRYGPILMNKKYKDYIIHYEEEIRKLENLLSNNKINEERKNEFKNKIKEIRTILYEN